MKEDADFLSDELSAKSRRPRRRRRFRSVRRLGSKPSSSIQLRSNSGSSAPPAEAQILSPTIKRLERPLENTRDGANVAHSEWLETAEQKIAARRSPTRKRRRNQKFTKDVATVDQMLVEHRLSARRKARAGAAGLGA